MPQITLNTTWFMKLKENQVHEKRGGWWCGGKMQAILDAFDNFISGRNVFLHQPKLVPFPQAL